MKTFIIILILAALGFLGYSYYGSPSSSAPKALSVQTGSGVTDQGLVVGQKTLSLLRELDKVKIDHGIFSSAAFQSLQDFGVEIQSEAIGRPDPFAPVGFESGTVTPSVTTTDDTGR